MIEYTILTESDVFEKGYLYESPLVILATPKDKSLIQSIKVNIYVDSEELSHITIDEKEIFTELSKFDVRYLNQLINPAKFQPIKELAQGKPCPINIHKYDICDALIDKAEAESGEILIKILTTYKSGNVAQNEISQEIKNKYNCIATGTINNFTSVIKQYFKNFEEEDDNWFRFKAGDYNFQGGEYYGGLFISMNIGKLDLEADYDEVYQRIKKAGKSVPRELEFGEQDGYFHIQTPKNSLLSIYSEEEIITLLKKMINTSQLDEVVMTCLDFEDFG